MGASNPTWPLQIFFLRKVVLEFHFKGSGMGHPDRGASTGKGKEVGSKCACVGATKANSTRMVGQAGRCGMEQGLWGPRTVRREIRGEGTGAQTRFC